MLEVRDLWATYRRGAEFALKGASLKLRDGTLNFVWGPNGSGKSTFLRALAGDPALLQTSRQNSLTEHGPCAHSYVAQRASFAGEDSVESFLSYYRSSPRFKVAEYLRMVQVFGIRDLFGQNLGSLSGGQWKRVQCSAQLSLDVPLYFFDEPDAALDLDSRQTLALEMSRKAKVCDATVVVASHDAHWLMERSDTLTIFKDGKIVWHSNLRGLGPALDLIAMP